MGAALFSLDNNRCARVVQWLGEAEPPACVMSERLREQLAPSSGADGEPITATNADTGADSTGVAVFTEQKNRDDRRATYDAITNF